MTREEEPVVTYTQLDENRVIVGITRGGNTTECTVTVFSTEFVELIQKANSDAANNDPIS